ncbi:unnamed protein product [Discula destructiva]
MVIKYLAAFQRRLRMLTSSKNWAAALLMGTQVVKGYTLNLTSEESVKSVASDMADDMMSFYNGNEPGQTPGLLPLPYYWWEGGALMGALIDYWYYTGDTRWNDITQQGLLWQTGTDNDYMPPNQTLTEGNDDQSFWGMAALSAAEYGFPNPPANQPQWLALAQAVFNTQAARWDMSSCNGGLRWQIFTWNKGFDYKNSISQACFFNIAARLALYTGNATYADWAYKVWDWMTESEFMDQDSYYIYDGSHIEDNCGNITPYQWTYNPGAFLLGAAAMYNFTADSDPDNEQLWKNRIDGLLNGVGVFFIGNDRVMSEVACESVHLCDNDQLSFKAYLARWMAAATKWAPWTYDTVKPLLDASASAAAQQCTGGDNGRMCGLMWTGNNGRWDGTSGVGQQMAAMEVVLATMIDDLHAPVTSSTGGTSVGNPSAGAKDMDRDETALMDLNPIKTVDKAWAWILTILLLACFFTCVWYAFTDDKPPGSLRQTWADFKNDDEPGGIMRFRGGSHALQKFIEEGSDRQTLHSESSLCEPSIPLTHVVLRKGMSMASVSVYSTDQKPRQSAAILRIDDYPDEQPWRRPARQGDFAGAVDPNRGNGAGFGIIEGPIARGLAPPSSLASEPGSSVSTAQPKDLRIVTSHTRELTAKMATTTVLHQKHLPSTPGLGKRQQGQTMSSAKV